MLFRNTHEWNHLLLQEDLVTPEVQLDQELYLLDPQDLLVLAAPLHLEDPDYQHHLLSK